jgi:hypothetical protein
MPEVERWSFIGLKAQSLQPFAIQLFFEVTAEKPATA